MYQFGFEKLEVWKESRRLVHSIYLVTGRFPPEEKFGITSQLRRAAISVCSNIAEGCSRTSFKEQAHFSSLAFGSLIELLNQLIISNDLLYFSIDDFQKLRKSIQSLSVKLNNLRTYQLNKSK